MLPISPNLFDSPNLSLLGNTPLLAQPMQPLPPATPLPSFHEFHDTKKVRSIIYDRVLQAAQQLSPTVPRVITGQPEQQLQRHQQWLSRLCLGDSRCLSCWGGSCCKRDAATHTPATQIALVASVFGTGREAAAQQQLHTTVQDHSVSVSSTKAAATTRKVSRSSASSGSDAWPGWPLRMWRSVRCIIQAWATATPSKP